LREIEKALFKSQRIDSESATIPLRKLAKKTALKPEIWLLFDKKSSQINVDDLSKQQITSELNAYRQYIRKKYCS
jgi:hypothetical protein